MKLIDLRDLLRKKSPIMYIQEYNGIAVFKLKETVDCRVRFTLEKHPLGDFDVQVSLLDSIDHTPGPLINVLRDHIQSLYEKNQLP